LRWLNTCRFAGEINVIASQAQPDSICVIYCDAVVPAVEEVGPSEPIKFSPKDESARHLSAGSLRSEDLNAGQRRFGVAVDNTGSAPDTRSAAIVKTIAAVAFAI
jgi:hypothetical protein